MLDEVSKMKNKSSASQVYEHILKEYSYKFHNQAIRLRTQVMVAEMSGLWDLSQDTKNGT